MKNSVLLTSILLLLISCSKKEEVKFEAFSPEAFAYDIGDSWEVNSTINVRGFKQEISEDDFSISITYTVDLETPSGKVINSVFENTEEKKSKEEISDIQLESQFEMDSTYTPGYYKIIFNIEDNYSGEATLAETVFELEN